MKVNEALHLLLEHGEVGAKRVLDLVLLAQISTRLDYDTATSNLATSTSYGRDLEASKAAGLLRVDVKPMARAAVSKIILDATSQTASHLVLLRTTSEGNRVTELVVQDSTAADSNTYGKTLPQGEPLCAAIVTSSQKSRSRDSPPLGYATGWMRELSCRRGEIPKGSSAFGRRISHGQQVIGRETRTAGLLWAERAVLVGRACAMNWERRPKRSRTSSTAWSTSTTCSHTTSIAPIDSIIFLRCGFRSRSNTVH